MKERVGTKKNWGFDERDMDRKVRPQDDFYRYAGGTWLKENNIPHTESRWGTFTILRYETEKKIHKLFKALNHRARLAPGSPERVIRDFYRSGMNQSERTRRGIRPIAGYLKNIAGIATVKDLLTCIADLHAIGVSVIWNCDVDQDLKNNDSYILYLGQGGLGMPDRDYYLKDDKESKRVRDAYRPHVAAMLALAGTKAPKAKETAEAIYQIERRLAQASMTKEDRREIEKIYNKMPVAKLERLAPSVDWRTYFKKTGANSPRSIVVCQPDFFTEVSTMITDIPLEYWRAYLSWQLINSMAAFLSPKLVRQNFAFYGTVLTGTKKMLPLWRQVLATVNASVEELVGRAYVHAYFSPEAKQKANALVDDLFAAYEARIKKLSWMSSATKQKAILKLRATTRKIGYPDKWKSYRGLIIKPDDYAGNVLRTTRYEHRRMMKKLGKKVDRTEWHMSPQTVNASCNQSMNGILFPAAILQPPCFDPTADDAVNYSSMGSIIGHELTHNFDDQGAKFDKRGRLQNWWTPTDMKKFKAKAKPLIKQFNAYTVADGVHVNGRLTLGENVADLGGLVIAYDAYQRRLEKTGRKNIDGFTPEQRFFFSFTIFDRMNARPEIEKTIALTDPHSPARYRINGPLSNFSAFYTAFNVKKGDKMYRPSSSRTTVW